MFHGQNALFSLRLRKNTTCVHVRIHDKRLRKIRKDISILAKNPLFEIFDARMFGTSGNFALKGGKLMEVDKEKLSLAQKSMHFSDFMRNVMQNINTDIYLMSSIGDLGSSIDSDGRRLLSLKDFVNVDDLEGHEIAHIDQLLCAFCTKYVKSESSFGHYVKLLRNGSYDYSTSDFLNV